MATPSLYPANPPDMPDQLTAASAQYKTRTGLLLLSLGLFFFALFWPDVFMRRVRALGRSFFVRMKPIRKRASRRSRSTTGGPGADFYLRRHFRLYAAEPVSPRTCANRILAGDRAGRASAFLFDFIQQVCRDVSQQPAHVYVDHAVNAHVMADATSIFNYWCAATRTWSSASVWSIPSI